MPQHDQWILLAVIVAVAFLLVIVAAQSRPRVEAPREELPAPTMAPAPVQAAPVVIAPQVPPKKRKRKKPERRPASPSNLTPIESVLRMLKQKDGLAKAFIIREILDAPVSRRSH